MKPVASLLMIMMLFLTAQPLLLHCQAKAVQAMEVKKCCGEDRCDKKNTKNTTRKPANNKDCERNACNPFASCSQCPYTNTSRLFMASGILKDKAAKIPVEQESTVPGFNSECWNPPERMAVS